MFNLTSETDPVEFGYQLIHGLIEIRSKSDAVCISFRQEPNLEVILHGIREDLGSKGFKVFELSEPLVLPSGWEITHELFTLPVQFKNSTRYELIQISTCEALSSLRTLPKYFRAILHEVYELFTLKEMLKISDATFGHIWESIRPATKVKPTRFWIDWRPYVIAGLLKQSLKGKKWGKGYSFFQCLPKWQRFPIRRFKLFRFQNQLELRFNASVPMTYNSMHFSHAFRVVFNVDYREDLEFLSTLVGSYKYAKKQLLRFKLKG